MPASIGVNMRVTGHYSQGGRKYMEDKFSVAYQQTEDEKDLEYAYFGIFDGHGGSEAADYAKEHLMDSIVKERQFWSDNDEDVLRAIRNGYMMTHMNMWRELEKWPKTVSGLPSTAGTTASVAFIRGGKIYIGHVGDSAIVLGYQVEGEEKWSAKSLTMDHKPDSIQEMNRISSSGGKVIAKAGVHRVVWNRPSVGPEGSLRCDEIPFLAVARSLGDLWSYNHHTDEFIVSPDPDVGVLLIDPSKYRCLIFGTDGLWNMVSPETAVQLVQAAEKHNERAPPGAAPPDAWLNPSKILVDTALEMWANTKMRADNTSVVTLMMDPPGPPRNRGTPHTPPSHHTQSAQEPAPNPRTSVPSPSSSMPDREANNTSPGTAKNVSIVKRFPDNRPAPPPPMAHPYTHTTIQEVEDTFINNYGSPNESYFIARLLNKTQIRNTLESVYDEIVTTRTVEQQEEREIIRINNNNVVEEEKVKKTTILQRSTNIEQPVAPLRESLGSPVTAEEVEVQDGPVAETNVANPSTPVVQQENIQINEVSSSSPVDAPPKPSTRKPKPVAQLTPEFTPLCRSLRSHDTPPAPTRPQTRLAIKGRQSLPVVAKRNVASESKVPTISVSNNSSTSSRNIVIVNRPKVTAPNKPHVPVIHKHNNQRQPTPHKTKPQQQQQNQVNVKTDEAPEARITRSKDVTTASPADILAKVVKESAVRKTQSLQQQQQSQIGESSKTPNVMTRQRNIATPASAPRTFLRRQAIESENSKENVMMVAQQTTGPLKSAKRRNSGGGSNELEPKEKRRTRLDDKRKTTDKVEDEDVSSTEIKDSNLMLGINVPTVVLHCLTDVPGKRGIKTTIEDQDGGKSSRLKNKKEKKMGFDDATSTEVHSTTVNLENEPVTKNKTPSISSSNRALRSRQDNVVMEDDKRCLRSAERTVDKETRPVLRSRNSVTGITPKITPRRVRTPWSAQQRQNLRKRFSK